MIGVVKTTTPDYRIEYAWYVDDVVIANAIKKRIELVSGKLALLVRALAEGTTTSARTVIGAIRSTRSWHTTAFALYVKYN
jgi:Transcription factor IIE (TFIIE), alpha subunit